MSTNLQLLKRAVARVVDVDEPTKWRGSAFYVGGKYVLTAWHVVAVEKASPPRPRSLKLLFVEAGHSTLARAVAWDDFQDWAILECDSPPPVTPLPFGRAPAAEAKWTTFGFPEIDESGIVFEGHVVDPDARDPLDARLHAIQLFAKQAAAGVGPAMHGFSGAPCMVEDSAVGILRSTLVTTGLTGAGAAQTLTVAGTAFACPANVVTERAAPHDRLDIPGWSPPPASGNFIVVLAGPGTTDGRLVKVAEEARKKLPNLPLYSLDPPVALDSSSAVEGEASFLDAVRSMCTARVVVFEATEFTPEVMLLLGIRAAVRRGVTILSVGGDYALGGPLDVPFNLQDANIVSHSPRQQDVSEPRLRPIPLLATRIQRALETVDTQYHLDLPVYEAVRRLPPLRRVLRSRESGVLVLCAFSPGYVENYWNGWLKDALENEWDNLKAVGGAGDTRESPLGVSRSVDLVSPQLVSRAIYEEIRRAQCCVADLTGWTSTVFFEVGVRLAVSPEPTVCLIDKAEITAKPGEPRQRLAQLLVPEALRYQRRDASGAPRDWMDEEAFRNAYGPTANLPRGGITGGAVYRTVARYLAVECESASREVFQELLDSAQLFSRQQVGGVTGLTWLYVENKALREKVESADFERRLATWFYLVQRWGVAEVMARPDTRAALSEALHAIERDHKPRLEKMPQTARQQFEELMDTLLEAP